MRGRKPKPTKLKIMAGKPGHRPLPKHEPEPVGKAEMPAWLSADAQKVWAELAPEAITLGTLTSYDVSQFAMLCTEEAAYRKDPAGTPTTAKTLIKGLYAEFGKGPSSRSRIQVKPPVNPIDAEKRAFGLA